MKSRAPFLIVIAAARGEINLTGNNSLNRIKYPLNLTQLRSGTRERLSIHGKGGEIRDKAR